MEGKIEVRKSQKFFGSIRKLSIYSAIQLDIDERLPFKFQLSDMAYKQDGFVSGTSVQEHLEQKPVECVAGSMVENGRIETLFNLYKDLQGTITTGVVSDWDQVSDVKSDSRIEEDSDEIAAIRTDGDHPVHKSYIASRELIFGENAVTCGASSDLQQASCSFANFEHKDESTASDLESSKAEFSATNVVFHSNVSDNVEQLVTETSCVANGFCKAGSDASFGQFSEKRSREFDFDDIVQEERCSDFVNLELESKSVLFEGLSDNGFVENQYSLFPEVDDRSTIELRIHLQMILWLISFRFLARYTHYWITVLLV